MDENDKQMKNDSSCPFGATLTGITTDFFTYYTDDINQSFDLSREYLKSEHGNKSQIYGEMQQNSLTTIFRICQKQQIKVAFYQLYNHSAEDIELTVQERQKLIYKRLFKVQLTLYRKLWVKLQAAFNRLAKHSKVHFSKPQLPQKNSVKKLIQFFQCWKTKKDNQKILYAFTLLKGGWEKTQKIQILDSIIRQLQKSYLTEEKAFELIKKEAKGHQKYEVGFKSMEIIIKSYLLNAFNILRSHNKKIIKTEDKKVKLSQKFQRVKAQREHDPLNHYGQRTFLKTSRQSLMSSRQKSDESKELRFNRSVKKKKFSFRNSEVSHKTRQISMIPLNPINIKKMNMKLNQKTFVAICDIPVKGCERQWHNFNKLKKLQYLRPNQAPHQKTDQHDLFVYLPLAFGNERTQSSAKRQMAFNSSPTQSEHIYFKKSKQFKSKQKRFQENTKNTKQKNTVHTLKSYYFPEQSPRSKQLFKYKSNKKIREGKLDYGGNIYQFKSTKRL